MEDKIEKIGKSLIQHGKVNNRIYLLKLDPRDHKNIIPMLDELATREDYSKIFCKIQSDLFPDFLLQGYSMEAYVPQFYNGRTDCIMASKFRDEKRRLLPVREMELFIKLLSQTPVSESGFVNNHNRFHLGRLGIEDAVQVTEVFKHVFETYPFPVHDPQYIRETIIEGKARYFGIRENGKLAGVSTAETDMAGENAEMTDFAVLPEYRGMGMAFRLLMFMEDEMRSAGIKTGYTIARLKEPGMNKTFLRAGYNYTGTLVNNTNIGGRIESMNIFYKHL